MPSRSHKVNEISRECAFSRVYWTHILTYSPQLVQEATEERERDLVDVMKNAKRQLDVSLEKEKVRMTLGRFEKPMLIPIQLASDARDLIRNFKAVLFS